MPKLKYSRRPSPEGRLSWTSSDAKEQEKRFRMQTLTNADFLSLWESGRTLHPIDQGLLAVHAAFPETRAESVADWPLGRRNRALTELHCTYFDTRLHGWTSCPQCGDKLEFEMDARTLAAEPQASQPDQQSDPIVVNGQAFRLPTSRDLARIADERDATSAAIRLLEHCRIDASLDKKEHLSLEAWTEEQLDAVGERMAQADPLAEILLSFACPVCGSCCQESLDLPTFLWAEMEGRAKRLLFEIHALASAYGWTESEILSLSAARRECYLDMVHA